MISRFSFTGKSGFVAGLLLSLFQITFADSTTVDSIQTTPLIAIELSADTISFGDTVQIVCKPTIDSLDFTLQKPDEWQKFSTIRHVGTEKKEATTIVSFALSTHKTCTIPSLIFSYPLSDSTTDTVSTGNIEVTVLDVLPVDESELASVGNPMKAGTFPYWIFVVIAGVLVVILLLVLFGVHLVNFIESLFKKGVHQMPEVPKTPPYDEAIQYLSKLEEADYLGKGAYKEYTFELSDILKRYIGRRYNCLVHESTSTEFREWIQKSDLIAELKSLLNSFITETDPVKFANINPGTKALVILLEDVKQFLEKTRPVEESEEKSSESEVSQ